MHRARSGSSQTAPARQRSLPDRFGQGPEARRQARIDFDAADFDPSNRGDFTPGDFPGSPPDGGQSADFDAAQPEKPEDAGTEADENAPAPAQGGKPEMPGGGFGGGNGSSDVKLQYIDDDPESYQNIFGNAKTDVTSNDEARLIESLKKLSSYEDLEDVLDMDAVLRYFVVHNFVVNGDSYTGSMIHNYYLYEQDGKLSMLPWDYNLAFGGFQGNDATSSVNDPIDDVLSDRPMQAWIFSSEAYTARYHEYYAEFLQTANIDALIDETYQLIVLYVEKDPTKFCTAEEFETGVQTLKTYCALRERSVQGQLDGTIASTSAAQQEDGTSLVDASSITLSDMGSMANTMGGGRGFDRKNGEESADGAFTPPERPQDGSFQPPSETEAPEDADAASGSSQDIQTASGEDNAARPQRPDDNAADNPASTGTDRTQLVLLGACVLALLGGLLFALLFKRR